MTTRRCAICRKVLHHGDPYWKQYLVGTNPHKGKYAHTQGECGKAIRALARENGITIYDQEETR